MFGMGEVLHPQQQGSAAAAISPGRGRHFSVLVAHLVELGLRWNCCVLQGLPREVPQQTTSLLCPPAWLFKQKYFSVSIDKNSSL